MKRRSGIFLFLFFISAAFYFSSCSDKPATTGTLTVTVIDSTGGPSPDSYLVCLAISLDDLTNKNFYKTGYTNTLNKVTFPKLEPRVYWYITDQYQDLGAIQVYAAKDYFVTLFLNSPKKK